MQLGVAWCPDDIAQITQSFMVACTDALYVITTLTVGQENNVRTLGSGVLKIEYSNKKEGNHEKEHADFFEAL